MPGKPISRLCQAVLPAGYQRVERELPAVQEFLERGLPPQVSRALRVLTLNDEEIVVAALSPTVASYLRLHGAGLAEQLRASLGTRARLRFRTLPEGMLQTGRGSYGKAPRKVEAATVDTIRRSAECIEDENLREVLLSLADSMK